MAYTATYASSTPTARDAPVWSGDILRTPNGYFHVLRHKSGVLYHDISTDGVNWSFLDSVNTNITSDAIIQAVTTSDGKIHVITLGGPNLSPVNQIPQHVIWNGSWNTPAGIGASQTFAISLSIDSTDTLHFVWINRTDNQGKYQTYNGSWSATSDQFGTTGDNQQDEIAIAVAPNGNLAVVRNASGTLKYYLNDGSWQSPETIEATGDISRCIALAIDSNNFVHVLQWNSGNTLVYNTNKSGAWVKLTKALSYSAAPAKNAITVDALDNVYIAPAADASNIIRYHAIFNGDSAFTVLPTFSAPSATSPIDPQFVRGQFPTGTIKALGFYGTANGNSLSTPNSLDFVSASITNDGVLATYNTSLITAVQRVPQSLSAPSFVLGGRNSSTYKLFKKTTTYGTVTTIFRSKVYQIGQDFDVVGVAFNLIPDLVAGTSIIPVLYFDDSTSSSVGTAVSLATYANSYKRIELVPANFTGGVHGKSNFFLELQFVGSALAVVDLPIFIDIDIMDTI